MPGPKHGFITLTGILVASLGVATHTWTNTTHRRTIAPATQTAAAAVTAPTLSKQALQIVVSADRAPIVTVAGDHFGRGLTVTARNEFYVFAFGAGSLAGLTPKSFQFDASALADGTYDLSVRNESGRPSNVVTLTVRRK